MLKVSSLMPHDYQLASIVGSGIGCMRIPLLIHHYERLKFTRQSWVLIVSPATDFS